MCVGRRKNWGKSTMVVGGQTPLGPDVMWDGPHPSELLWSWVSNWKTLRPIVRLGSSHWNLM